MSGGWWDRLMLGPWRRRRQLERGLRQLDKWDELYGIGATPGAVSMTHDPARSAYATGGGERRRVAVVVLLVLALFAGWLVTFAPGSILAPVESALGLGPAPITTPHIYADGHYKFLLTQPGDPSAPVTYSRCRMIHVQLNPAGGPANAAQIVRTAVDTVEAATGLPMIYDGTTSSGRSGRPQNAPVLVSFATPEQVPALAGNVVGEGGSVAVGSAIGFEQYTTGMVTLDKDAFADMSSFHEQAVVDHEFGHVMGLDHVQDRNELMYPTDIGLGHFGHGDLTGLALLGRGKCG